MTEKNKDLDKSKRRKPKKKQPGTPDRDTRRYKIQYHASPIATITWQRTGDDFIIVEYNFAAISFTGGKISQYTGTAASEFYKTRPDILADLERCFQKKTIVRKETPYRMISTGEEKHLIFTFAFVPPDLILLHSEDITEYKQAEAALHDSEATARALLNAPTDLVMLLDPSGVFVDVNEAAARRFNKTRDKLIGLCKWDLFEPKVAERRKSYADQVIQSGRPIQFEDKQLGKWWDYIIYPVLDHTGKISRVAVVARDITERKEVREKLRGSEALYRSLVDNMAIGVSRISPDMEILNLNNQMKKWYPHIDPSKKPLCYKSFNDPPREEICSYCPTHTTLQDGEVHESITETPAGDEIRNYRIISSPIKDHKGNVVAAIEMVEDITDRVRAEKNVLELSQQLLKAQESERQMISSELHDRVAQDLSTLKISLETLFEPQSPIPGETRQKLQSLSKLLDRSIMNVRDLSYELRPPGLDEMGLVQAVSMYCEEFVENTGINIDFQAAGLKNVALDSFSEINLYRLIQEGLNNVRKHANASQVTVKLVGSFPNIILRVEDNGKGFDVDDRLRSLGDEKRMGLRSMEERVRLLQGKMAVKSQPMKGTKILIKFPIKEKDNG